MPAATTLPTTITAGVTTGHEVHSETVHGVINSIYKVTVGSTQTGNFTATQAMSGEFKPCNSASSIAVTLPALEAGTIIQFGRKGAGALTFTASGTTITLPTGATASGWVQGSIVTALYETSTVIWLSGDLT